MEHRLSALQRTLILFQLLSPHAYLPPEDRPEFDRHVRRASISAGGLYLFVLISQWIELRPSSLAAFLTLFASVVVLAFLPWPRSTTVRWSPRGANTWQEFVATWLANLVVYVVFFIGIQTNPLLHHKPLMEPRHLAVVAVSWLVLGAQFWAMRSFFRALRAMPKPDVPPILLPAPGWA